MSRSARILFSFCLVAVVGCKGKEQPAPAPEAGPPAPAPRPVSLDENAKNVLEELGALETKKDVTCWTSFRQLDWYIAGKNYTEFATLAKIAAMKRLVRAVWAKAASGAGGPVGKDAVVAAVAKLPSFKLEDAQKKQLQTFANDVGIQNFTDYQKTAEHWRVVLAVIMDEMYYGGQSPLRGMDRDGLRALADATTTLSLMLLKESNTAAEAAHTQTIDTEHVQTAYLKIMNEQDLKNPPGERKPMPPEEVVKRLQPITRDLIEEKAKALLVFNKTPAELTEALNKVGRMKLTEDATALLVRDLQSFAHFIAAGFEPMRADNYLSDGSFAKSMLPRLAYITEDRAQNTLEQLFPHQMLNNGDILVRFEPNPGPVIVTMKREPFEIKMIDHEMNGVRDSAVHWLVLKNVWAEKAFAMDPFAAEYLSEVLSMMMTLYIRRGETIAKEMKKDVIDADVVSRVRTKAYVMVPPRMPATTAWTPERQKEKETLLAAYSGSLYADVTAKAGLPTRAYFVGEPLGAVDSHGTDGHGTDGHGTDKSKGDAGVEGHGTDKSKVDAGVEAHGTDKSKSDARVEAHGVDSHGTDKSKVEGHGVQSHGTAVQGHFDVQSLMGGGLAVGDLNNDGYPDVFVSGEGAGKLYLNKKGRFSDATATWALPKGLDDSHGSLFFDMEGDGDLDLLVLRSVHPSIIFENTGKKLVDATEKLGLQTHNGSHVASVFDYDKDGDLDIFVGYYGSHERNVLMPGSQNLPSLDGRNGSPSQLWQRGENGRYTEVAEKAGVADTGWVLATGAFDHDLDGDLDLYLATDFGADQLYINRGDGTFDNQTEATGTGDRGSGMNVDFTDINDDGFWDIYITNIDMFSKRIKVIFPRDESTISIDESLTRAFQYLSGNKFYVSDRSGTATLPYRAEEGTRIEPGDRGWGWDTAFYDYENDGDDDMYLVNGWVDGSYAGNQKNQMFLNQKGFFFMANPASAEAFPGNSRSTAAIDMDVDGDVDLLVNNFRQAPRVLENTQKSGNRWIKFRLTGVGANSQAIGALIKVQVGDRTVLRHVTCGRGYISQADPTITVGVGKADKVNVTIQWPDGKTQTLEQLPTNKRHDIKQS